MKLSPNKKNWLTFALICGVLTTTHIPGAAQSSAKTRPEANRLVKTQLSQGEFYEPIELAVLPNLDVLIVQRRGEILRYDTQADELVVAGILDVYFESGVDGVNAEEGVLGIALDPDFAKNHFVYIFHSPAAESVNRLSRFTLVDGFLDMDSEITILEFFSQRGICCHTGGSVAFGPDRLLYLSTGDNSTPFNETDAEYVNDGFAPLNPLTGKEQYDARRSSANTNDLRGKILRIRVLPDGSYEIPEGNLFPATNKTRPEIFTMGHRNPYRISVDPKTGTVYWGDVGPDATEDKLATRGPRGYDEINRAAKAGNYGWPMFVGDNYPYLEYNYADGSFGEPFDPASPINDSPNNTGLHELPPAQAPFVWYPYGESPDFDFVGDGGRNAMAGPVYYAESFPEETRLADYFDGKVFLYDWMRRWVVAAKFSEDGQLLSTEPFMEHAEFAAPIDMELGPDGRIYVLEYGSKWFQKNPDSGLARIDYFGGNRPPEIESVQVNQTTGASPLKLSATVEASDPDQNSLTYRWTIGAEKVETETPVFETVLESVGWQDLQVTVTDSQGATAISEPTSIYVGNAAPTIDLRLSGNQSFYFPDRPIKYKATAWDPDAKVDQQRIALVVEAIQSAAGSKPGHQVVSRAELGQSLMMGSDCRACHQTADTSIGPSFIAIANRYAATEKADAYITEKIRNGSYGVWGEGAMPGHPAMSDYDAQSVAQWILSLAEKEESNESLPARGKYLASELADTSQTPALKLTATYTDQPVRGREAFTATAETTLRSNQIGADQLTIVSGVERVDGLSLLAYTSGEATLRIPRADLSGVRNLLLTHERELDEPLNISVHYGDAEGEGEEIANQSIEPGQLAKIRLRRPRSKGSEDLYLTLRFTSKLPTDRLQHVTLLP